MKKHILLFVLVSVLFSGFSAYAYDKENLPRYMSFAEAIGISDASEIRSAQVVNINENKAVDITLSKARVLYNGLKNLKTERTICPTPFSGIALCFTTDDKVIGYYTNSGIQIGLYGAGNYICYVPVETNEYIANVRGAYYEAAYKKDLLMFPVNEGVDFLKLPNQQWAVQPVREAAAKTLLPYNLTGAYEKDITREEFCILIGNMIAVCGNYKSVGDYMRDNKTVYEKHDFTDCDNADEAVDILHTLGIVNGKSDTEFYPDAPVTREEAAKIISRSAELFMPLYTNKDMTFRDKDKISDWAAFYTSWCNEHGIMMGDESENFNPKDNFTVSEAVVTVSRLYNKISTL